MSRTFLTAGVISIFSFAAVATASVAPCTTTTWNFGANGIEQCGSGSNGVSFTQGGETITILPELVENGVVQSNSSPVSGLFEVQKGASGNLASGIGPYNTTQGGSPFTGQQGIQDSTYWNNTTDDMLYIEVNQSSIPSGTTLKFLMQEGDQVDTFNVFTSVGSSSTPPNLSSMTEVDTDKSVGTLNGGATTPQFSIVTSTTSAKPIEFIAIEADCTYLLLNSITATAPAVPEPRFYGLLLTGLLGLAGLYARKRQRVTE
jgi:hypothetical protein